MPCTAGGLPVAIDMLLGHVKLGTSPLATALKPLFTKRATLGTIPSRIPCSKYAGSPPSMHTTTTGREGQRYRTPLSCMPARLIQDLSFAAALKIRAVLRPAADSTPKRPRVGPRCGYGAAATARGR